MKEKFKGLVKETAKKHVLEILESSQDSDFISWSEFKSMIQVSQNIEIKLIDKPLNLSACQSFVEDPAAGGIVHFVGAVRNHTKGKTVVRLDFEAYKPMAVSEMRKIAEHAIEKFGVIKIAIHHRVGLLEIGELPVIIAVSSAHRKAAFQACQYCIDTLKETVPIWKKEIFEDGEVWVSATP